MEIKPAMVAIAAFIVVVVLGAVLMPVLDDATETERTFSNVDGSFAKMVKLDNDTSYTFSWDHANPTVATVNGEQVSLFKGTLMSSAGTFLARYGQDSTGYFIQWVPSTGLATVSYSSGTGTADLSITISSGTATIVRTPAGSGVGSETTNTTTITEGFAIAPTGNYVMKQPTQHAYMNSDSEIYAMGLTTIAGNYANGFYITGDLDSVTVTQYNPNPATYTISDVAINSSAVSGFDDLYSFDSVTFTATQIADTSITANCTYNYVIVPAEVTAEKSVHLTDSENAILLVIPALVIIAIIIGVLAVAMRGRE